ncbi:hypothetical protein BJV82DRAFT_663737 [Fennellomyces sp. T-0311]|nr:hypothetical protein BJV82DRAFT_663737 [Fennellomyces sp. T-0311]
MDFSLPSTILNDKLVSLELIEKLKKSIEEQNHCLTIEYATIGITEVKMSVARLDLLDIRAHAYSMHGNFESALEDAEQMIEYGPTLAAGYLCKGNLFSMYGYQNDAMRAYESGINAIQQEDNEGIDRLLVAKVIALSLNERQVDFMAMLPTEVTNDIIVRLSQEAKSKCAMVSKAWRSQVLHCSDAWTNLVVTTEDKEKIDHLIGVTSYIAKHIKNLTINIKSEKARTWIERLNYGTLTQLKSFELTARSIQCSQSYTEATLVLWQARSTLTTVKIDQALSDGQETITLAQLLSWCNNITDLMYTTNFAMVINAGDFSSLDTSHPVSNMELEAREITGADISEMLKRCKQLRRLKINGCDETVLDSISNDAPGLQILMYNASHTAAQLKKEDFGEAPGLRKIDGNTKTIAAATRLLSLIYKNRKTLERVCLSLESVTDAQLKHLYPSYPQFRIENMTGLIAYRMPSIESLALQWIRNSTALTELSVGNVPDLNALVKTLMGVSPLEIFRLARLFANQEATGEPLIRLFDRYAKLSDTRPEVLTTITLWNCAEVNDSVLASLSNIKTLKSVHFGHLSAITVSGLSKFLESIRNRLTHITLDAMNIVSGKILEILARSTTLKNVTFQLLKSISGPEVRFMVDDLNHRLDTLTLNDCSSFTEEDLSYIRDKVKRVTIKNK